MAMFISFNTGRTINAWDEVMGIKQVKKVSYMRIRNMGKKI